jgi:hypothetical protein
LVEIVLKQIAFFVLLLGFADVAASRLIWSGAPSDATPGPEINFWHFEIWRLKYWLFFALAAGIIWLIVRYVAQRPLSSRADTTRFWTRIALGLLGAALTVAVEVATSVSFQRTIPWTLASFIGWSYLSTYLWQHLICWAVTSAGGLGAYYLWCRRSALRLRLARH